MTSTAHALLGNTLGNVVTGAFRRMDIAAYQLKLSDTSRVM